MFQMLLRILIAFSGCVRNVNSGPLPPDLPPVSENNTGHQWQTYTTHQSENDTTPQQQSENDTTTINPETLFDLQQASEEDDYSIPAEIPEAAACEGDIMMNDDRNAGSNLWKREEDTTNGTTVIKVKIPYQITDGLEDKRTIILAAMKMISDTTCVSFHEWKEEECKDTEPDYLVFRKHRGCASYVGCIGGPQTLYVGPNCWRGNVCHEILHALGLNHEQTRSDFGNYIEIVYTNIREKMKKNFRTIHANTLDCEYDTCSIMHYGTKYFSKNGLPTIIVKKESGDCTVGQRHEMTELDIVKIRTLYCEL